MSWTQDSRLTCLPLQELWGEGGFTTAVRGRFLTASDVISLLRTGPIHFVVADVGCVPLWIEVRKCFDFWKTEAKPRLASEPEASVGAFPESYCYFAFEWGDLNETPIVVLEKHH